jgi:hypothetical protein
MNDYGYMERESRYVEYNMSDIEFMYDMRNSELIKELYEAYEKVTMEDWFGDEQFVEKSIPEFNFV